MKRTIILLFSITLSLVIYSQQPSSSKAGFTTTSVKDTVRFFPEHAEDSARVRHLWLFGDGRVSEKPAPEHIYAHCGNYRVKHHRMVLDTGGAIIFSDSVISTVNTACPLLCDIRPSFKWEQFRSDPMTGNVINGPAVFFTVTSFGLTPENATLKWTFEDGTLDKRWNFRRDFRYGGNFRVCLQITYGNGCLEEKCEYIMVRDL
ncbi:MAG: PKD domain-containing protein [Sphingobacteriales bacterium]|nr:PKD domain-containing protein [Sphingobacteriales bacterium]